MDSPEISAIIRIELSDGEVLLWSGQPRQGVFLRGSDAFLIPFSVMWGGFAIVWTVVAGSASPLFALFGVPFVCIGLYLMVGRFFVDAAQRSNTVYAVTDRRLLIIRSGRRPSTSSTDIRSAGSIDLKEAANGRGTITFGPGMSLPVTMPPGWPMGARTQRPQFDSIDDARRVYQVIRDTSVRTT